MFAADVDTPQVHAAPSSRVTPLSLDVTDPASVAALADTVGAMTDGLDAVINFAGVLSIGSMVELEEETLQRILDVNVMGMFRVNKALFPLVLARRGRIINMSSETGQQAGGPFNGAYAMSKHAVEAYSDSLRREAGLLGVQVIKIQPGPFRTQMVADIERQFAEVAATSSYFGEVVRGLMDKIVTEQAKAADPALLASVVYEALTTPRPKAAYSVRPDPRRMFLERLPTRWADEILRRVLQSGSR